MEQINLPDVINETSGRNRSAIRQPAKRIFGFYLAVVAGGVVVDQASKLLVRDPFRNYQFAFSLPVPWPAMYAIYAAVLGLVVFYLIKKWVFIGRLQKIGWCFIFAGAVSNIGERILLGYVRDFIPLFGGILNLADLLILGGIALLLYQELFPGLRKSAGTLEKI